MDVEEAIRTRVSVKEYVDRAIPRDRIEHLLELAGMAPNHRMTQPLEYRVMGAGAKRAYGRILAERKAAKVGDAEAARAVTERVLDRATAVPTMIAVVVREDDDPEIREEDYATAFMAIQNLSLAAVGMGLGTHIKTGAVMGEASLREALEVGEEQRVAAIVFLGEPESLPDPKPRIPAPELTRWLD